MNASQMNGSFGHLESMNGDCFSQNQFSGMQPEIHYEDQEMGRFPNRMMGSNQNQFAAHPTFDVNATDADIRPQDLRHDTSQSRASKEYVLVQS